jgi:YbbR domain-containing protein
MKIPANDLLLMICSLGLAILLWMWVGVEERSEIVVSAPLEYRNLPRQFEISSESPPLTSVNIWVKASTTTIKNLRPQEVSAWVDLTGTRPGDKNYELTPENVTVPYGFTVLRISPSRIHLKIEEVVSRFAPVVPRLEGEPPPGYVVSEVTTVPARVEIIGPQSAVSSVRQVTTDSVDVSSVMGSHVEKVNVGLENPAVRLGATKEVTISFKVSEVRDELTLRRMPVTIKGTGGEVRFNPKTVRIEVVAPKRLFAQLSQEKFQVEIDVAGLKPGVYELTPRVVLNPEYQNTVSIKEVIPERIHVRIL